MKKKNVKMPIRYKRLDGGQGADLYFERSLDLIFSPGCFTVEIEHSGEDVGLPMDYCGEEHYFVGNLVVTDSGIIGREQKKRVTGQFLTITSRKDKETNVFTRTYVDGVWSQWSSLARTGMYDNISTPDELLATVAGLVNENTRVKQVEVDFKSRAVDISSQICTAGKENITLTGKSMDGEVVHSVEFPAATTEKAGVMSAGDKKVINKLSSSLSEERPVTVGKFINLNNIAVGERLDIEELFHKDYAYFKEECSTNDVFNVTTTGNNNQAAKNYAILDTNNIVIAIGDGNSLTNEVIVIPDGGAVFIVNSLSATIKIEKVVDNVVNVDFEEDKKVITKLSFSLSEEKDVTIGKFINLDNITVGESLNIREISQDGYAYFKEECLSGDVFTVTTSGNNGYAAKSYAIIDSNNIVLALGNSTPLLNEVVVIPDGGAQLIVNSLSAAIKVEKVINKAASVDSVKEIDNRFLKNIPFTKSNSYYNFSSAAIGSALTESIVGANGYSYAKIECAEGERYILSTNGNTSAAKNYVVLDSNNIVLALGNTTALVDETVIIPGDGKTLIVNSETVGAYIKKTLVVPSIGYDGENLVIDDLTIPLSEEYTSIVQYAVNGFISLSGVTVGSNVSIEEVAATGYSYILLPVLKGDRFRVVVSSGGTTNARICCVTDENMTCTFLTTTSSFDGEVDIVEDGYIIINAKNITACTIEKRCVKSECHTDIHYNKKDYYISLTDVAVGSQYAVAQSGFATDYCYAVLRVYKGQQFSITTTGNTKHAKSYAIFDNSMKCLAFTTSAQTDRRITIWQDGYLVVNSKVDGFALRNIDASLHKLNTEAFSNVKTEVLDARRYTMSDYNNSANFDEAYIGDTKTCALYLEYNRNIPTKGAVISRDISGQKLNAEHTVEEAQAFVVPYLFYNQQKVGTIVLFDEATGNPFIFDKNGNKKYLSYE